MLYCPQSDQPSTSSLVGPIVLHVCHCEEGKNAFKFVSNTWPHRVDRFNVRRKGLLLVFIGDYRSNVLKTLRYTSLWNEHKVPDTLLDLYMCLQRTILGYSGRVTSRARIRWGGNWWIRKEKSTRSASWELRRSLSADSASNSSN